MNKDIFTSLRKNRGLSQEQMAKLLGVSKSTIAMWETGKRLPSPLLYGRIADCLHVSIDYLFGRNEIEDCSTPSLSSFFSSQLNQFMILRNVSQAKLAEYVGVSQAAVSGWCSGRKFPRIDKIEKLCEILDVNCADLISYNQTIVASTELHIDSMHLLNQEGQRKLADYMADLLKIPEYRQDTN